MNRAKYFMFLLGEVADGNRTEMRHTKLLKDLFNLEYRWDYKYISDSDRADEGIYLRLSFTDEPDDFPCTILEMLIGLAYSMDSIAGEPGSSGVASFFWEMIYNIGLKDNVDSMYDPNETYSTVSSFMNREYDRFGNGGLFPIKAMDAVQNELSLWDQMGTYIIETRMKRRR